MCVSIKELMTRNYVKLSETLTPQEASSQLKDNNYGVIIDITGTPVALILSEDLRRAIDSKAPTLKHPSSSLPPSVIVGCRVDMSELVKVMTLFEAGARGAVIQGDKGVVGVLPVETVIEYIMLPEKKMILSASGGDSMLAGSFKTPVGKIRCGECGFINEISFLDEDNLPVCKNPGKPSHQLLLP